ncbi:MAG TPA: M3 family oligoendopeptidase [Thermomicrobiales bacterium]|nr:M3 family oligoendopeptidase [Thermomicrobiales bacterium]
MTETIEKTQLPHWDMTTIYPGLESPEFNAAVEEVKAKLGELEESVQNLELGAAVNDRTVATYDSLTDRLNALYDQGNTVRAFVSGYTSVDSRNELANARESELRIQFARLSMVSTRYTAWLGSLDTEALIEASTVASAHAYAVRQAKIEAEHLMTQAEEDLASQMAISGGHAWGKLHDDISSQIMVEVEKEVGKPELLAMTEVRNLENDPDRGVRQRAWEAEVAAWKQWETPLAATLNGVKGQHLTLAQRRGWDEVLDEALFQNHIDRGTLDAMMGAARDAFPDLHRYFAAKAKALGLEKLAWYDLSAPLSAEGRKWEWDDAVAFVNEQFGTFSDRLRGLSERAFDERWIDAEPRSGKTGGAFCMGVRPGESRILSNFSPSFDGVSTLAHELGHAYHNMCEEDRTMIQAMGTPMTLAETASTFCETILRKAALNTVEPDEQIAILEGALQDAAAITVDITSRFLFEQSVFARRAERELSADEFCQLMTDAQKQTYGDAIEESTLHPYMWAVKPHYYSMSYAFYNYPYMFGLLFGTGLYAQYERDPDGFRASYDDLLSSTGMAGAAELAGRFGIDIRSRDFWQGSLDVIREDVDRFVALVDERKG